MSCRPDRSVLAEKRFSNVAPVWSSGTFPAFRSLFHSVEPPLRSVSMVGALGMDPDIGEWLGPSASQMIEFRIGADNAGQRLDKCLRKALSQLPVSHLFKMIRTKDRKSTRL